MSFKSIHSRLFWPKELVLGGLVLGGPSFGIMPPKKMPVPPFPEENDLTHKLADLRLVRTRLVTDNQCTKWLNEKAVGIKSVKAMSLNASILEVVAKWRCPQFPYTTALRIGAVRPQVGVVKSYSYGGEKR